MHVRAPITGLIPARAADAASAVPMPNAVSTEATPAARKSMRGGYTESPPMGSLTDESVREYVPFRMLSTTCR